MTSSSSNLSSQKFRPYFTLSELRALAHYTKTARTSEQYPAPPLDLIRYLDRYILDIEQGLRKESMTLAPTMLDRLGLSDTPAGAGQSGQSALDSKTLFAAWQANATLSVREIIAVQQYRYENDLMSPTEESAHEKANGISF